jgi:hypothetical protein
MNSFSNLTSAFDVTGIITGIETNILWVALGLLVLFGRTWIQKLLTAVGATSLIRIMVFWVIFSLIILVVLHNAFQFALCDSLFLAFAFLSNQEIGRFSRIGVVDAYSTTVGGVNYKRALSMATKSMDFLGIGGDKITIEPEFEEAMVRCASSNQKVRFLLSPHYNPVLEKVARLNGTSAGSYGDKVKQSVTRIAELRKSRSLDIEVRYYAAKHDKDYQQFRLMFINDHLCLWSWTVWGKHIGRDNPQVILKNLDHDAQVRVPSAYKAFKDHFDALWSDSETVRQDFLEYETTGTLKFPSAPIKV